MLKSNTLGSAIRPCGTTRFGRHLAGGRSRARPGSRGRRVEEAEQEEEVVSGRPGCAGGDAPAEAAARECAPRGLRERGDGAVR